MEEAMQHVMETETKVVENGVAAGESVDLPVEGQAVTENNDNDAANAATTPGDVAIAAITPGDDATPDTPSEEVVPVDTPVQNGKHEEDDDNADSKSTKSEAMSVTSPEEKDTSDP